MHALNPCRPRLRNRSPLATMTASAWISWPLLDDQCSQAISMRSEDIPHEACTGSFMSTPSYPVGDQCAASAIAFERP